MEEGKFITTIRRLFIMIMVLIVPELIVTWAARQFFSARIVDFSESIDPVSTWLNSTGNPGGQSKGQRGKNPSFTGGLHTFGQSVVLTNIQPLGHIGWTITHGFFVWMGGFVLYVNDEPRAVLRPEELQRFVNEGSVDMPVIPEEDLQDRSKGDVLSKCIVVLQLGWFIAQLVARSVQKLPVTLLEIDTLAVTVLTCIAYGWWWKKPLDVGRPYPVHWKATASPPGRLYYEYVANIDFTA
jgi:hypothetical protein